MRPIRNVIFAKETIGVVLNEGADLLRKHYLEVAKHQDIELAPNHEMYFNLENNNFCHSFTARENGELIGYCVFFVQPHIHYKKSLWAIQDVIFIHPEKRGLGLSFVSWCDSELKKMGVQVVTHHVKKAHNWGPALQRLGYEEVESTYARRLDAPQMEV